MFTGGYKMFPFTAAKQTTDTTQNKDFDVSVKSLEAMQGDQALITTVNELNDLRKHADQPIEVT